MTSEELEKLREILEISEELAIQKEKLERLKHEAFREEWGPKALAEEGPLVTAEIQWLLSQLREQLEPVQVELPEREYLVSVEGKTDKPRPEKAKTAAEAVRERFISDVYNLEPYQHPENFVYVCEGQRFQCESSMECGTLVLSLGAQE